MAKTKVGVVLCGALSVSLLFVWDGRRWITEQHSLEGVVIRAQESVWTGLADGVWLMIEDGKVATEGRYKAGIRTGQWRWYFEDGSVHIEGQFDSGRETGVWRQYTRAGALVYEWSPELEPHPLQSGRE